MLGNVGDMREKAERLREQLARKTVDAEAGAGAVRVVMTGTFEVTNVTIDPSMVGVLAGGGSDEDRQMVEELLVSAFNAAMEKAQELARDETMKLTGDIGGLGDMKLPPA